VHSIYLLSVHVSSWTGVVFKQLAYSATKWFLSEPWLPWVSEALMELSHWTPCLLECSYGALLIRLICRAARLLLICAVWCNMYQIPKCLILLFGIASWKQTCHLLYSLFWVITRHLNFMWNRQSVPKCWYMKFTWWGIPPPFPPKNKNKKNRIIRTWQKFEIKDLLFGQLGEDRSF